MILASEALKQALQNRAVRFETEKMALEVAVRKAIAAGNTSFAYEDSMLSQTKEWLQSFGYRVKTVWDEVNHVLLYYVIYFDN